MTKWKEWPSNQMCLSKIGFSRIREQIDEAGRAYIEVTDTGMEPLLRPARDMVIVDRTRTVYRGDVVLFYRENGQADLCRVIRKGKGSITVAGDSRWYAEKDLSRNQILGVVSRIQRDGRFLSRRSLSLKLYTFLATWLAYPRIFLGQITGHNEKSDYTEETREQECA